MIIDLNQFKLLRKYIYNSIPLSAFISNKGFKVKYSPHAKKLTNILEGTGSNPYFNWDVGSLAKFCSGLCSKLRICGTQFTNDTIIIDIDPFVLLPLEVAYRLLDVSKLAPGNICIHPRGKLVSDNCSYWFYSLFLSNGSVLRSWSKGEWVGTVIDDYSFLRNLKIKNYENGYLLLHLFNRGSNYLDVYTSFIKKRIKDGIADDLANHLLEMWGSIGEVYLLIDGYSVYETIYRDFYVVSTWEKNEVILFLYADSI